MRKPIQCEGVERGPAKAQIAAAGGVNPAFWGDVLNVLKNAGLGAIRGALGH